jgi:hypothetical protein
MRDLRLRLLSMWVIYHSTRMRVNFSSSSPSVAVLLTWLWDSTRSSNSHVGSASLSIQTELKPAALLTVSTRQWSMADKLESTGTTDSDREGSLEEDGPQEAKLETKSKRTSRTEIGQHLDLRND